MIILSQQIKKEAKLLFKILNNKDKDKDSLVSIWFMDKNVSKLTFFNKQHCQSYKVYFKVIMEQFLLMGKLVQEKLLLCKETDKAFKTKVLSLVHLKELSTRLKELQGKIFWFQFLCFSYIIKKLQIFQHQIEKQNCNCMKTLIRVYMFKV